MKQYAFLWKICKYTSNVPVRIKVSGSIEFATTTQSGVRYINYEKSSHKSLMLEDYDYIYRKIYGEYETYLYLATKRVASLYLG